MLPKLRSRLYWFIDELKGSQIKNQLKEIQRVNDSDHREKTEAIRERHIQNILSHAAQTVPFYKEMQNTSYALESFPVVNKNKIRESQDLFTSDQYNMDEMFKIVTSGSTGTPFRIYQDPDKKKRNIADTMYFSSKAGYEIGNRLFFMRVWGNINKNTSLKNKLQNVKAVDVLRLNDQNIPELVEDISKSSSKKSLLGYASAFDRICNYLDDQNITYDFGKVNSIIAISEALDKHTATSLKKYFNCQVYSRYSNNENGMLAQQIPGFGSNFLINKASYHIEILKMNSNDPAEDGSLGRIVVTDFFNKAMPMIRYDTGDIGIKGEVEKDGKIFSVLTKVEGRKMDLVMDTNGEPLSSFLFSTQMKKFNGIKQFQFIQHEPKRYEFKLNAEENFSEEAELIANFKAYLGQDAELIVSYEKDDIPLLSSGKRKKVVNLYDPSKTYEMSHGA